MSSSRQSPNPGEHTVIVRSLGLRMATGHEIQSHRHPWGQVIFASRGVMNVEAGNSAWIVPPQRSVWVPPATEHAIQTIGATWLRTAYIHPSLSRDLPSVCRVLSVSPLLRALLLEVVRLGILSETVSEQAHLALVLLDQVRSAPAIDLELPLPRDPRARRLGQRLREDPAGDQPFAALFREAGASRRTLERLFVRETGLTLGRWRHQARLQHALRRLGEGAAVTTVSFEVGYEGPSAFIAMFRRSMGMTPGRYQSSMMEDEPP